MKKIITILPLLLLFLNCSKDDAPVATPLPAVPINLNNISLTTKVPTNVSLTSAVGGGVASIQLMGQGSNYTFGVCYGLSPNPAYFDGISETTVSYEQTSGNYSTQFYDLVPGKTYYVRAFVRDETTIKYGNQVTFNSTTAVTTDIVKNITSRSFEVSITVPNSITETVDSRGICYSTASNPTINNDGLSAPTGGTGTVSISFIDNYFYTLLNPNTVYYLRSYVYVDGEYYYGNEVTFKTTGYIGGSGSYVFFDKGETTNGWRYLEVAPNLVNYTNTVWGCPTTFISGLQEGIGTGLENTNAIIAACNYANVVANVAKNASINNKTDWFLPSIDELKALYHLKADGVITISPSNGIWSSTQVSANQAKKMHFSDGSVANALKNGSYNSAEILPIRRF
jgi:hypothetical protein